jgi:hypothetical protein
MIVWGIENGYVSEEEEFDQKLSFLLIMGTLMKGAFITKLRKWIRQDYPLTKEHLETIKIQWQRLKDNGFIIKKKFAAEDPDNLGIEIVLAQTCALGWMERKPADDSD